MLIYSIQLLLCTIHILRWLDPGSVPARYITEDFLAIHCLLVNVFQPVLIKWSEENCHHHWALSMRFVSTWGFGLPSSTCCVCMYLHMVCCCLALCAAMNSWMWIFLGIAKLCCLHLKIAWRVLAPTCHYFLGEYKLWLVLKAGWGHLCQGSRASLRNVKIGPLVIDSCFCAKEVVCMYEELNQTTRAAWLPFVCIFYSRLVFVHWL